jgi:tryptophan-rich sensory protein
MNWLEWYQQLAKPTWTPAPATIGLIWQLLYPVIAISFGYVFYLAWQDRIPRWIVWPFAINLLANLLFSPIQFQWRNLMAASVDVALVWATIIWAMVAIWPHSRWVAIAQVPYLIWVSIAMTLQFLITAMNRN